MKMIKWPPEQNYIKDSICFEQIEKPLIRYMKMNNFKQEEINYILYMMNSFVFLNKPELHGTE